MRAQQRRKNSTERDMSNDANKTVFIYTLADPRNGLVRYVGKANDLKARYSGHLSENFRSHKSSWVKSLKALGLKPKMELLEAIDCCTDEEWQEAERFWIEQLRQWGLPLTNLDKGGRGKNRIAAETRLKLSQARIGKKQSAACVAKRTATLRALKLNTPEGWARRAKKN